ncbi:hypothetical protein BDV98DRAFT_378868 [Pterulicium gracile]|uniref:Uncharacterized protein n=1 Tax=Pterulicium gracile TaxID=1884261 RepID=A0A5C3Q397_9AGAR|nr:hypothetical protein BDV98DRAFT_378868 [Pterula gracilis]
MKKERFACRCDRTHPVINQLHFPHTPRGKCTTQEKTFLGFSTIVFTLMGTFLRQFDTHRANKLLAHPWFQTRLIDGSPRLRFKFKDAVYVGLLKPITKDQVSLFRTCILWFQDTKGPASMSFASTVTRYPNARLAFDKIVLEFPEITQELLKLLMEGVHVYLCNTGPERKTALDVHQELMVLLNRMAPLNPGGTWPKTYWRSQAPMILANIHHVVSELKKSPPPNWQQEMWPVKMIELVKAVYPWGVRRMLAAWSHPSLPHRPLCKQLRPITSVWPMQASKFPPWTDVIECAFLEMELKSAADKVGYSRQRIKDLIEETLPK